MDLNVAIETTDLQHAHVRISHVLQMCSNFLAGDALRSSHRFRSLDETAILGTACRHEMPLLFVNLKHGER